MMLYIVRHGETYLNTLGCLQGQINEPLNQNGRELAEITGEAFRTVYFDLIITSPLVRASETARLVAKASQKHFDYEVPVLEDPRLMEIGWGEWERLGCLKENFAIPADDFNLFFTDPLNYGAAPGGESMKEVCQRTSAFFQELIHNPEYQDKTILISTHGCAMRALLQEVYEDKTDFWHGRIPYNCAVNIVKVEKGRAKLVKDDGIYYDPSLCYNHYKAVEE